jgi:hypothetical protein
MKPTAVAAFVVLALAVPLAGCKKSESGGSDGKPSADDCKKAFDHWATVSAKKNGGTREDKLSIQTGNIASCPKMMSPAGIKCFNDLTEANVGDWPQCLGRK